MATTPQTSSNTCGALLNHTSVRCLMILTLLKGYLAVPPTPGTPQQSVQEACMDIPCKCCLHILHA